MKTKIITFSDLLETLPQSNYKIEVATERSGIRYIEHLQQCEIITDAKEWVKHIKWIKVSAGLQPILIRNKCIKPFLKQIALLNRKDLSNKKRKVNPTPQQVRKKIITLYKQGFSGVYIAEKLKVTAQTVSNWLGKYKQLEKQCNLREKKLIKQIDRLLVNNDATITDITDLMKGLDTLKKYHNTIKTRF